MNREREREFKSERVTCAGGVPCPLIPILIGPIKAVLIRNEKKTNKMKSTVETRYNSVTPPPPTHTPKRQKLRYTHTDSRSFLFFMLAGRWTPSGGDRHLGGHTKMEENSRRHLFFFKKEKPRRSGQQATTGLGISSLVRVLRFASSSSGFVCFFFFFFFFKSLNCCAVEEEVVLVLVVVAASLRRFLFFVAKLEESLLEARGRSYFA